VPLSEALEISIVEQNHAQDRGHHNLPPNKKKGEKVPRSKNIASLKFLKIGSKAPSKIKRGDMASAHESHSAAEVNSHKLYSRVKGRIEQKERRNTREK